MCSCHLDFLNDYFGNSDYLRESSLAEFLALEAAIRAVAKMNLKEGKTEQVSKEEKVALCVSLSLAFSRSLSFLLFRASPFLLSQACVIDSSLPRHKLVMTTMFRWPNARRFRG